MTDVKKNLCRYGEIEISNSHPFSDKVNGFKISPYMQDKMVFIGQNDCYGDGHEVLANLLGVSVGAMQLYRVTDCYGSLLEQEKVFEIDAVTPDSLDVDTQESVYAMVDGSMLFTREEDWKEVKLGRIFKQSDCMDVSDKRGWVSHSIYEAYLGKSDIFTDRMDRYLGCYRGLGERLIFVGDGAKWIWKWVTAHYPSATQILDWYHALEHLHDFAKVCFLDKEVYGIWVLEQEQLLKNSQTDQVIKNIKSLELTKQNQREQQSQLITYYTKNMTRMDYKKYQNMGAGIIGSGAIEAANRQVVQKRMKLSGQRWSKRGAQNMLTLRTTKLSDKWNKVVNLICNGKNKAA